MYIYMDAYGHEYNYVFIYLIFYKYEQNWIDILAFAG